MSYTCLFCFARSILDPSQSMSCRNCNADRDAPCKWSHGSSHESRRSMALHWNFDTPCRYRNARQTHEWVLSDSLIPMQNEVPA